MLCSLQWGPHSWHILTTTQSSIRKEGRFRHTQEEVLALESQVSLIETEFPAGREALALLLGPSRPFPAK